MYPGIKTMKNLSLNGVVLTFGVWLFFASPAHAAELPKVRLFILSGQSNMVRFDPDVTFTPALKQAYPGDELTVVIGRLSEFKNGDPGWDAVRSAQVKVSEADPLVGWVDTDKINGGKVSLHYSQQGYAEMGRRFAAKSVELLVKAKKP